jgi:hypothetical protein
VPPSPTSLASLSYSPSSYPSHPYPSFEGKVRSPPTRCSAMLGPWALCGLVAARPATDSEAGVAPLLAVSRQRAAACCTVRPVAWWALCAGAGRDARCGAAAGSGARLRRCARCTVHHACSQRLGREQWWAVQCAQCLRARPLCGRVARPGAAGRGRPRSCSSVGAC